MCIQSPHLCTPTCATHQFFLISTSAPMLHFKNSFIFLLSPSSWVFPSLPPLPTMDAQFLTLNLAPYIPGPVPSVSMPLSWKPWWWGSPEQNSDLMNMTIHLTFVHWTFVSIPASIWQRLPQDCILWWRLGCVVMTVNNTPLTLYHRSHSYISIMTTVPWYITIIMFRLWTVSCMW